MKWRKNFVIPNCNYNIIDHPANAFINAIPLKNGQPTIQLMYFGYENGTLIGYMPLDELKVTVEWIKEKVVSNPEWADKLHQETEKINKEFFDFAKSLVDVDFKEFSDSKLLSVYRKLRKFSGNSHARAVSTTWFMDSEGEVYSNYLRQQLNDLLKTQGIVDSAKEVDYFILLTSPTRSNFAQEEEIEFLELLQKINKLPAVEKDKIIYDYYKKWRWTPYGYIGPAYTLEYYEKKIKDNLDKMDIKKIKDTIKEELKRHGKIKKQQEQLIKEINIPKNLEHSFAIARDIIWLKDYRKYCFWHGHYILDFINSEIARRLNLSLVQVNYLTFTEMEQAFAEGKFDENILNARLKRSVIVAKKDNCQYFFDDEARKILDKMEIEEQIIDTTDGFKGTCACPGKVNGKVKIVIGIDDLDKVKESDIMVSLTTYPSFLPAMKRAGAIITEDGGITCHAAIVAREFRIPCVVGVKKVTELLKDGDVVSVDAVSGLIKRI